MLDFDFGASSLAGIVGDYAVDGGKRRPEKGRRLFRSAEWRSIMWRAIGGGEIIVVWMDMGKMGWRADRAG